MDLINIRTGKNNDYLKQIVVVSGKGGTGKTTLTAAFAAMTSNAVISDCDVDAADLHILLQPDIKQSHSYLGGKKAVIDPIRCTECSLCEEYCRFNAIHNYQIDPISCEGCGFCFRVCPENAIDFNEVISGYYYESIFTGGDFLYAALEPGEGNSGKLVSEVKQRANIIAKQNERGRHFVDGPPGIGCPVNASLAGADFAVIITEPTVSGLHDMERVLQIVKRFAIPASIVINKYDLNLNMTENIEAFAAKNDMPVSGKIPFDESVDQALLAGQNIMEFEGSPVAREIYNIWDNVTHLI